MSRAHAARQLLALGPLTFRDFVAITGWPYRAARKCVSQLQEMGEIVNEAGAWRLA